MTTATDVINEARKHVGYVEGNGKDNMFGKWYGLNHAPWCAMFVSYVFNKARSTELVGAQTPKGYSLCSKGIAHFKAKNAWHPVAEAKPGDVAFFDWGHDGGVDHTGIVVANDPAKRMVKCIEGNTSSTSGSNGGKVKESWRNYSVIMGVGRPAYGVPKLTGLGAKPQLKLGSKGNYVRELQRKLGVTVDGDFGPVTEKAVNAFKIKRGLKPDGIVGPNTWAALDK